MVELARRPAVPGRRVGLARRHDTPDAVLDRLAGLARPGRFTSSARYDGVPGRRAWRAFDGDRGERLGRRLAARPAGVAGLGRREDDPPVLAAAGAAAASACGPPRGSA